MPELPEVETIRGHLAPHVEGRTLEAVEVLDPRWSRPLAPSELTAAVQGRVVEKLARRGKYLVWELTDDVFLLMHLRMTGTLLLDPTPAPRAIRTPARPITVTGSRHWKTSSLKRTSSLARRCTATATPGTTPPTAPPTAPRSS